MAKLIMATRAPETTGFPAILNEMLRRAHYTFRPEYEVYAHGYGVGLVDYMATLHLEARMVVGAVKYDFRACGTLEEMIIQEVAREASPAFATSTVSFGRILSPTFWCRDPRLPLLTLSRLRLGLTLWRSAWQTPFPPMRRRIGVWYGSWRRQGVVSPASNTKWSPTFGQ
jgi:hypothetical protein